MLVLALKKPQTSVLNTVHGVECCAEIRYRIEGGMKELFIALDQIMHQTQAPRETHTDSKPAAKLKNTY